MPIAVIGERRAGIERLIHEVIVCCSVELVRARSHGEIEKTAARLPQLGRVIAGLDREFLHGVGDAKFSKRRLGLWIHVADAVDLKDVRCGARAGGLQIGAESTMRIGGG